MSALVAVSCNQGTEAARILLVNGSDASLDSYLAVVPIKIKGQQSCTGTFISPKTVLTVASCLTRKPALTAADVAITVGSGDIKPTKLFLNSVYSADPQGDISLDQVAQDLAVISFDSSQAPGTIPLLGHSPVTGQDDKIPVIIVGYGANSAAAAAAPATKRTGSNTFTNTGKGVLTIKGPASTSSGSKGTDSMISTGDGGSPAIFSLSSMGAIAATVSSADAKGQATGYFVDLSSPQAQAFFSAAAKAGVELGFTPSPASTTKTATATATATATSTGTATGREPAARPTATPAAPAPTTRDPLSTDPRRPSGPAGDPSHFAEPSSSGTTAITAAEHYTATANVPRPDHCGGGNQMSPMSVTNKCNFAVDIVWFDANNDCKPKTYISLAPGANYAATTYEYQVWQGRVAQTTRLVTQWEVPSAGAPVNVTLCQ